MSATVAIDQKLWARLLDEVHEEIHWLKAVSVGSTDANVRKGALVRIDRLRRLVGSRRQAAISTETTPRYEAEGGVDQ